MIQSQRIKRKFPETTDPIPFDTIYEHVVKHEIESRHYSLFSTQQQVSVAFASFRHQLTAQFPPTLAITKSSVAARLDPHRNENTSTTAQPDVINIRQERDWRSPGAVLAIVLSFSYRLCLSCGYASTLLPLKNHSSIMAGFVRATWYMYWDTEIKKIYIYI